MPEVSAPLVIHGLAGRIRRIAARVRLLAQSGSTFLVDVGDGPNENGNPQARVYDRREHVLHPPFARDSIVARGYWDDVPDSLDAAERGRIRDEIRGLL